LLPALWICWAGITVVLAGLLMYRSLVARKGRDQLFLDPAERQLERERRAILNTAWQTDARGFKSPAVSTTLLLLIAGVSVSRNVELLDSAPQPQSLL
jgi:hypothetical protein